MSLPRFSIASVMAAIVYVAVGLVAFRNAGDNWHGRLWNDALFMMTVGMLVVATILAGLHQGRARGRWLGFAAFGWGHLIFGWPDSGRTPLGGTWRPRFPHTEMISSAIEWVFTAGSHQEEGVFK